MERSTELKSCTWISFAQEGWADEVEEHGGSIDEQEAFGFKKGKFEVPEKDLSNLLADSSSEDVDSKKERFLNILVNILVAANCKNWQLEKSQKDFDELKNNDSKALEAYGAGISTGNDQKAKRLNWGE